MVCEPFTQWVLEDAFTLGRPPYEDAGVQIVDDVEPYELMKLRLLNASHQALCYFGHLAGYRLVHEAAQDPLWQRFLLGYMDEEGTPTLAAVPGVDLDDYKRTLIERFSNPEVRDTIARLCAESSDRIPKWLLPVVRRNLETGGEIRRSAAVVASWARYAEGVDEQGEPIKVVDRLADERVAIAQGSREDPARLPRPTASCSATSSTTSASWPPTGRRSTRCTSAARGRRWRRSRKRCGVRLALAGLLAGFAAAGCGGDERPPDRELLAAAARGDAVRGAAAARGRRERPRRATPTAPRRWSSPPTATTSAPPVPSSARAPTSTRRTRRARAPT